MNKLSYLVIVLVALTVALLPGCKKDDVFEETNCNCITDTATVTLKFNAHVRDENFALDNTYYDVSAYRYKMSLMNIYISNITLLKDDGTEVLAKDVALLRWDDNFLGDTEDVELIVEAGSYTGLKFDLGLDSTLNATDPNVVDRDHPLSIYQGTFWNWNDGYRFVMLEGNFDTIPNGTGTIPTINNYAYHTGTNPLYRQADLSNAQQSFSLEIGENFDYELKIDVNKFFYQPGDTVTIKNESFTHTVGNFELAERITNNGMKVFSLDN